MKKQTTVKWCWVHGWERVEEPPLTFWQILLTVVVLCAVAIVVAGLMFQNAVNLGMIQ